MERIYLAKILSVNINLRGLGKKMLNFSRNFFFSTLTPNVGNPISGRRKNPNYGNSETLEAKLL